MTKRSNNPSRGESERDEGRNEGIEREGQRGPAQHEGDGEVGLSGADRGSQGGDKASQRPGGKEQGKQQQGGQQQGGQQQGSKEQGGQRQGQQKGSESTRSGTGEERKPVEEGREFEGENIPEEEGDTSRDR